jgi:pilus assembly protein Flp/PilA
MASEEPTARRDRDTGASAVEYGLVVFAIAALVVAVVFALGGVVSGLFSDTCASVASVAASSTC